MKEPIHYPPFYNLKSPLLSQLLGVKDPRSIMAQIHAMGVKIRIIGKNKYVITQDILEALAGETKNSSDKFNSYISDDPRYKDFL